MVIYFTKFCKWRLNSGEIRSYEEGALYDVNEAEGSDIISAGYGYDHTDEVMNHEPEAKNIEDGENKKIPPSENKMMKTTFKKRGKKDGV
jgi:hypothetical protein